jgi:hypothetical protein
MIRRVAAIVCFLLSRHRDGNGDFRGLPAGGNRNRLDFSL